MSAAPASGLNRVVWILAGLVILLFAVLALWLGVVIMPTKPAAEKVGTLVPWYFTWGLIWLCVLMSVAIAISLLRAPASPDSSPHTT